MTLKTLLLGSAAAFAVVGGAQAADLSVAEPVESVRICDAFAGGYWYIPGSDTCLKIGGSVEFQVNLHSLASNASPSHSGNWDFLTKFGLTADARSVVDVGTLEGYVKIKGTFDGVGTTPTVTTDEAWLSLGALKAGHFDSPFKPGSGFVDYITTTSNVGSNNKLQLGWAAAGFGLALGIEDPRETWGSSLPDSWSMPLITGAITASSGSVAGFLSAGFVQLDGSGGTSTTAWGVSGKVDIGIGANDKLKLIGIYGDGKFVGGGGNGYNNGWSAIASFQHLFSSKLAFDVDYSYLHAAQGSPTADTWNIAGDLVWTPYTNFKGKLIAGWTNTGTWSGRVSLARSW
ncbi:MAG: porin [Bauldia sp.]